MPPKPDGSHTGGTSPAEARGNAPQLHNLINAGCNEKYDGNQMAGSYFRLSGLGVLHHPQPLPHSWTHVQGPG
ncbi:hypothetical protein DFAR_2180021 [Desulfarculales bacterium]